MLAVDTAVRMALGALIGIALGLLIGLLLCHDAHAAPRIHIQDGQAAHAPVGPDSSGQPPAKTTSPDGGINPGGLNPALQTPPETPPTLCVLPDTAKFGRDDRGWIFIIHDCDPSALPHVWRAADRPSRGI